MALAFGTNFPCLFKIVLLSTYLLEMPNFIYLVPYNLSLELTYEGIVSDRYLIVRLNHLDLN
jgi:hypothetical protein